MDRKSKLAMPDRHKYAVKKDKFIGLSRLPIKPKISTLKIRLVKAKDL